jgi:hypothetical protein
MPCKTATDNKVRPQGDNVFSDSDFKSAIESAKAQLRAVEDALNKLATPEINCRSIKLHDLSHDKIEELLEEVPTGYAKKDKETYFVYVIQVSGSNGATISDLKSAFEQARKTENDYSRVNRGPR